MSKINGDKARTAAANRRRNKQRMKDRALRAAAFTRVGGNSSPVKRGARRVSSEETSGVGGRESGVGRAG